MRFAPFIVLALSVYSAIHAVVYWGLYPILDGHRAAPGLTALWMGLMIVAPLMVRMLDRRGHELAARAVAWIGYTWLGVVFLAFSMFSVIGVGELVVRLSALVLPGLQRLTIHAAPTAVAVALFTSAAAAYGLYEASRLRVETVTIATDKLGAGADRLRIVQVSDLHLGLILRERSLARIVARLRRIQPDLLVVTGDLVDSRINHLESLISLWQSVDPPLGKFAVTGNHEVYAGLSESLDFLDRSGFVVLRNRGTDVGDAVTLVGVDDDHLVDQDLNEATLLRRHGSGLFTVLLKHRPAVPKDADGLFDLQLSGHAHRGQIFPFNLLTGLEYPMQDGLYSLPGGGQLYVSRGTGTWGPPMRLLSPPELTVFEIERGSATR